MNIAPLLAIMASLRDPVTGCAWDIKQSFATIAPYTIEEAYEVQDAIARNNMSDLKEELGDLLLQVIFHAQMASEQGSFTFEDVVSGLSDKLIRRHPHVFGDQKNLSEAEIKNNWERIKGEEKPLKKDFFAHITNGLPPILKATKIQKEVAKVGFDWDNVTGVFEKIEEEMQELHHEITDNNKEKQEAELGDVLFAVINLARHLKIDPETALEKTNAKFMNRFLQVEQALKADQKSLETASLDEMENTWHMIKKRNGQDN